MSKRQYVGESGLRTFLQNLKTIFSPLKHYHTISEITDYTVDNALSTDSENPVQNKVINAEFDAISTAMLAFEIELDNHAHDDKYYTQTQVDEMIAQKSSAQIISWEEGD